MHYQTVNCLQLLRQELMMVTSFTLEISFVYGLYECLLIIRIKISKLGLFWFQGCPGMTFSVQIEGSSIDGTPFTPFFGQRSVEADRAYSCLIFPKC